MDQEPIPKELLDGLRGLSDSDLTKLIAHISDYSWAKSVEVLQMLMKNNRRRGK
jgi:hypothetical protein